MVRRRTVSKPVVSDVGSGAIRWGGEWHEVVGERKVAGLPTDGRSALDAGRGAQSTVALATTFASHAPPMMRWVFCAPNSSAKSRHSLRRRSDRRV